MRHITHTHLAVANVSASVSPISHASAASATACRKPHLTRSLAETYDTMGLGLRQWEGEAASWMARLAERGAGQGEGIASRWKKSSVSCAGHV